MVGGGNECDSIMQAANNQSSILVWAGDVQWIPDPASVILPNQIMLHPVTLNPLRVPPLDQGILKKCQCTLPSFHVPVPV